jgi:hypothetical protein
MVLAFLVTTVESWRVLVVVELTQFYIYSPTDRRGRVGFYSTTQEGEDYPKVRDGVACSLPSAWGSMQFT